MFSAPEATPAQSEPALRSSFRKLFEPINNRPVCCQVFRIKPIEPRSKVCLRVELRAGIYFPSQITHSNRAPWDEADAELLTRLKDTVSLRISFHERVFSLNCRNRLNGMRSADRLALASERPKCKTFPSLIRS